MPATEYFLRALFILSFTSLETKKPPSGLIVIKTFPYCGGSKSSPPNTETDSASGYICGMIAS